MPPVADRSVWFCRAIECASLFVGVPLALVVLKGRVSPIPILLCVAAVCAAMLAFDRSFDRRRIINWPMLRGRLAGIAALWAAGAAVFTALLWLHRPEWLFSLPKERPGLWAVILIAYPLLSVVPQTIIYRAFFMHRYRPIFGDGMAMVLAAGLAFSFGHILFQNAFAVSVTLIGGLLFAWRYLATRSLLASALEHALYGLLLFTVGWGRYLFHGYTGG